MRTRNPTPTVCPSCRVHSHRAPDLRRTLLLGLVGVIFLVGCAPRGTGPPFEPSAMPADHRGRIYLYRADGRNSLSRVRLTLGEQVIGKLADREYTTVDISAGSHLLRAALRSLAGVYWSRNEQQIRLRPGETVYVEVSVRLTELPTPGGRELEIAGRGRGGAGENVFLQIRPEKEALPVLESTTRITP